MMRRMAQTGSADHAEVCVKARPTRPRPIRIGISACLLGQRVRYDGGHQYRSWTAGLGRLVEWVPVCPEVELGLGTPREPIRLAGSPMNPRLVGITSGLDHTRRMRAYAATRLRELAGLGLSGYVFKDRSPSCGPDGVPVLGVGGTTAFGSGLFAKALRARFPRLPIAGDERLRDPALRKDFFRQALAYAAARATGAGGRG